MPRTMRSSTRFTLVSLLLLSAYCYAEWPIDDALSKNSADSIDVMYSRSFGVSPETFGTIFYARVGGLILIGSAIFLLRGRKARSRLAGLVEPGNTERSKPRLVMLAVVNEETSSIHKSVGDKNLGDANVYQLRARSTAPSEGRWMSAANIKADHTAAIYQSLTGNDATPDEMEEARALLAARPGVEPDRP